MASLITRDLIEDMIGTDDSQQSKVDMLIEWITQKAESIIGRKLSNEQRTAYLKGFGDHKIILPVIPVTAITSISLDADREFTETLDSSDYYCDFETGIVSLFDEKTPEGVKTIKVVYTAGYTPTTLPADLKFAFIEAISWNLTRLADKNFGVRNMTTPDGVNISNELVLPMGVQRVIDSYREARI